MSSMKKILETDDRLSRKMRLSDDAWQGWHKAASFLAHTGDSWYILPVLLLVWLFAGCAWHNRATLMGLGIVFLATLVLAMKFTFRRSRPPGDWGDVYRSTDPHSFPSGHAARVSYIAVMARRPRAPSGSPSPPSSGRRWSAWRASPKGVHYLSDIIAGAGMVIGIAWGLVTLALADFLYRIFSHIPFIVCPSGL